MRDAMEMISLGFIILCSAVCAFYALGLVLSLLRAIFKKEKFAFRKTIPFASADTKENQKPKHRMITAFVFPLLWFLSLDIADEHIFDCVSRIVNGTADRVDWWFSLVFFVSFYLWAGYIGYNGIPEEAENKG